MNPSTIPELLIHAAESFPDHGIGFIHPGGETSFHTFPQLKEKSLSLLSGLQKLRLKKGEMMILSLDSNEEIMPVLWSCFLGGIIPVLLQPPVSFSGFNPAAEKARKVFNILGHPRVILSHTHADAWRSSHIPEENIIDIANIASVPGDPSIPRINPGDIALIQFSSGSTGDPKGVPLTHRNILSNLQDIIRGIRLTPDDISVSWMPLFHDMGLIGFHFTLTCTFVTQYFIEPVDFVKNPFLWLDTLSEKKGTITGSPNFGQVLVNRFLNRKKPDKWDLSSIRVFFNGGESISVRTMNEFTQRLQPYGLRPESMLPAYGMAEATLAVSFSPLHQGARVVYFDRKELFKNGRAVLVKNDGENTIRLVSVGKPLYHCSIEIVDDNGTRVEEDSVGHVRVKGDNVTRGYYNNPEVKEQSFSGEWLLTGDMGFIYNGDLFITGRSKDIIFINGINYYSHDLEDIAMQVEEAAYRKVVIAGYFDDDEGRDKLIVFLAGSDNVPTRKIFMDIRNHLMKTIGIAPEIFIPVRSHDISRTSSGKIRRYKLILRFLNGEFPDVLRF